MRFPECGLAAGWWDFTRYEQMTDAEFIDLMTSGRDCFQTHVDAGELLDVEVPYDAEAPECWNGVNPYLLDDDAYVAAIDAYNACLDG